MNMFLSSSMLAQSADQGLSLSDVVDSLPTDPASVFALLITVLGAGAVMWFGRPRGGGGRMP